MQDEKEPIWTPLPAEIADANMTKFMTWAAKHYGQPFDNYEALRIWSTTQIEQFWGAIWEYFEVTAEPASEVLASRTMPGADWFPGTRVNTPSRYSAGQRRMARR